jgi:hypothetical protein
MQQLDSDDGLSVTRIDGTVIETLSPAFDKINQNFTALMNQNGSGQPVKIWTGSRTEYDAVTVDPDTLYFITE